MRLIDRLLKRDPDADLTDELRFHLEMEAKKLRDTGLAPDAARQEARRRLGGVDKYTEELRDVRGGRGWDAFVQDARYALRVSRRFPAFTLIVVATLGIAIGANTAIFSVVNATLLRPLPYPNGDRLALLYSNNVPNSIPRFSVSYADYLDWRAQTRSFTDMAAYTGGSLTLQTDDAPLRLSAWNVTSNFFDVGGVQPHIGRFFHDKSPPSETSSEVILAYDLWQRQFAGDPSIVGRSIRFASGTRSVIGVLPKSFDLDGRRNIDAVIVLDPQSIPNVADHGQHMVSVIARLKPGITQAAAQADLNVVAKRLAEQFPNGMGAANVFMAQDELVRDLKDPLLVLLAAAALVLLIGCINVANLLLTRSTIREREVALRQALGASRGRLVTQLLVESAELTIAGAALGLIIAYYTLVLIEKLAPPGLLPSTISLDLRVLAFTFGVAVVTTLLVGVWPAFRATSPRLASSLREGGRSGSAGRHALRARRSLVIAETALALVLLVCAGLVIQSLRHLLEIDPGFVAEHVVTMRVNLPGPRYNDSTQVSFFRDLQSRLEGRGGIEAVAAGNTAPISGGGIVTGIRLIGADRPPGEKLVSPVTGVTPGYFRTMGMRLLQGRDVAWSDQLPTIVASQAAVRAYWPGQSPIGKRVGFGRDTIGLEVVGVVNDTRGRGITTDPPPMLYLHYSGVASVARGMTLVVRGPGDVQAITATTRAAVGEIDRTLPLFNVQAATVLIEQSIGQPRLNTTLLSLFAGVALVLAAIGIYGVISYSVTQRSQEIGVRVALGAQRGDVLRLVLREGVGLAAAGVAIGIIGAFFATRLVQSWLFGIEKTDAVTMAATAIGLISIALLASYIPARRATKVDPLVAMRAD